LIKEEALVLEPLNSGKKKKKICKRQERVFTGRNMYWNQTYNFGVTVSYVTPNIKYCINFGETKVN
jgi:hypothetical protein